MIRVISPGRSTIIVTLLAIVFSLSLIGISNVKAQENQTTNQTQQTQFLTYTDPQARFSIKYPSTWEVKPATNRFESVLVSFVTFPFAYLSITMSTTHVTDPEVYVEAGPIVAAARGFSVFQEPECVKYKIEGQKACSYIATGEISSGLKQVFMGVNSFVNGHMYIFGLAGEPDTFDKDLPVMEQMLASFKAPP